MTYVHPFQASEQEVMANLGYFAQQVMERLGSHFLHLPHTDLLVEYDRFAQAYQVLYDATNGFQQVELATVHTAFEIDGMAFLVLRVILGLSPPEWAYLAGQDVSQGFARYVESRARRGGNLYDRMRQDSVRRVALLVKTACRLLHEPLSQQEGMIHRLDKVDTVRGLASLQSVAEQGVPYSRLLHERLLGRPFATYRDAISERVGSILEDAIEELLKAQGIPYYRPDAAEQIPGFRQTPDFVVPNIREPSVVIEAKLTEDDGTARDKVARILRLRQSSERGEDLEVVACIDGRGFGVRQSDIEDLLRGTRGKVFTLATLPMMVEHTRLQAFVGQGPSYP